LIKSHANTNDALTLPALRAAFLLQYGDVRRHTEQEVRDRLFAGEHYMKSGERVGEYTQRFRDIIRDAPSMTQIEMITWYVHGLPQAMRKWCATDASGRDWERLDDLIKFALGQEVRSRIASLKTASLNFVSTPRNKIAKKQNRKPPPRAPITCRFATSRTTRAAEPVTRFSSSPAARHASTITRGRVVAAGAVSVVEACVVGSAGGEEDAARGAKAARARLRCKSEELASEKGERRVRKGLS
jgi:hypothetical protein